jgi:hypothetical protein
LSWLQHKNQDKNIVAISEKPEFPPLLPSGLQQMSISELKTLTVEKFPLSVTRNNIYTGLEKLLAELQRLAIQAEIWIDGSFLTEKIDPEDCDLVVRLDAEFVERCSPEQFQILTWINSNLKATLLCDSYMFVEWPEGHEGHALSIEHRAYWIRWFSHDRHGGTKGIAVIGTPL